MKKTILTITVILFALTANAQDLESGGTNSWIFHTPDDTRTSLHIAPKVNGAYDWGSEFRINNDGSIGSFLHVESGARFDATTYQGGDLIFEGGNDWILHTPGTTSGNLHFASKNDDGSWDWSKQTYLTNDGGAIFDGNVGIGTRNPDSKLAVNGKIHCEEVQVDLDVAPDYVFQKYYTGTSTLKEDYTMPTLEEVEAYTKENNHLPSIPSAKEIKEEGLHLKEMTSLLLQKIEELTLYTIEQEKRIKALEKEVATEK